MIEIVGVCGVATVQDGGRPGYMHQGVPSGGPLVPEWLARANARVENPPGSASIEAFGAVTLRAHAPVVLGGSHGATVRLAPGQDAMFARAGALLHYVSVRGGIDVPVHLGGRGTLLVARLGGHEGRPLRRADRLAIGACPPSASPPRADPDESAPIRVLIGPDRRAFGEDAIDVLLTSSFLVDPRSDRVGMRLSGPPLAARSDPLGPSAPMVRGAIQVPPGGSLIVLGPDHPTTGGYPVVATVACAHLGSLAARPVGALVRFTT